MFLNILFLIYTVAGIAPLINSIKLSALSEAPPIKPPSISLCAICSTIVDGLTEPPYKILILSATSIEYNFAITFLISPIVLFASVASQDLPVPIAQIGS